jgi:hypothetical protein
VMALEVTAVVQRQLDGGSAIRTLFCGIMH